MQNELLLVKRIQAEVERVFDEQHMFVTRNRLVALEQLMREQQQNVHLDSPRASA